MKKLSLLTGVLVAVNLGSFAHAQNSSSSEFQCRSKAKEIAAETYKGCMTDQRQAQLEQIRKDYKEKLSELKSHYDKELKKLSNGKTSAAVSAPEASAKSAPQEATIELKKLPRSSTRASGARSLPTKKGPIKTQVIDLSTPAVTQDPETISAIQSENRLKIEQDEANNVEIVELPTQE
ncbi:MAG: hypothetical protein H7328_01410 [Bdellovibrio sp.]|nr:hypothetical protein [Bdellovibrio sp.]